MNNDKIKIYKNSERKDIVTQTKYVPQYQTLGIEPESIKSSVVPNNTKVLKVPSSDNPRIRQSANQPYADTEYIFPVGSGPAPNVGNNMDHTWSSVDGNIIDDLDADYQTSPDHPMIHNNEIVNPENHNMSSFEDIHEDDVIPILNDLDFKSYLLLVKGIPICSGPATEIEDQVRALIFGEHELSGGVPISEEDLIVLKKVYIKVGVFLE